MLVNKYITKKYEANHFLKMFPDRGWRFNGLKHLTEKVTALTRVQFVVDHTMPTSLQRSTKLKISHWYFWLVSLPHQEFIFCQKHFEQAFFYVIFHSYPFNEMFIVNGKSHCCNDTFTDVRFTSLLVKNIYKNTNYFMLLESAFH